MHKYYRCAAAVLLLLCLTAQSVWAAADKAAVLEKIRYGQTPDRLRIVFDLDQMPEYTVTQSENPLELTVDFANTTSAVKFTQTVLNDPIVDSVTLTQVKPGLQRAVIALRATSMYKVFALKNPDRIVVDILRKYNQKFTENVIPGVTYTYWAKGTPEGPIVAYIADIAPRQGLRLKMVLAKGEIPGVDTVGDMAAQSKAVVAVNGSYFAWNGDILGLLKINGDIVSTPELKRSVFGIMPDGTYAIGEADYSGTVTLPGGAKVPISGVNTERTQDALVLYNSYYGDSTRTNHFGTEYGITDGKVAAIGHGNMRLVPGMTVLSANGASEKALAKLALGDAVTVTQRVGDPWDKARDVLGAGPMLVKNGNIYLTTKTEDFGSDVAGGRAPRTAVGITKDGHVLLVVVDGRQARSIGMTLLDLASFMQKLGAVDAMNLDGGGSSDMVVKGRVVNKPSDGRERKVGDALVVTEESLAN
jgi:hypothetical protein